MKDSIFGNEKNPAKPPAPSPHELIEKEVQHLKKGSSVRHGPNSKHMLSPWPFILVFATLLWLYAMDPVIHAWYKGEGIRTYLYLHNYGAGPTTENLIESGLLTTDEILALNQRKGSFQDYYASPVAANQQAQVLIKYMDNVRLLHAGKIEQLDWLGKIRCFLFIRNGIFVPTSWSFLDPSVDG